MYSPSSVGEGALAFDQNFIATPHQVTLREKILVPVLLSVILLFFSILCFGLLRPLQQIFRVWLTQTQENVLSKWP